MASKKKKAARAPAPPVAAYPRIVHRGPRRWRHLPIIRGQDVSRWTDFYQAVLSAPWWLFLLGMAFVYACTNVFFAGVYLLLPGGGPKPGSFWDSFFFSVQTVSTPVFGELTPQSFYTNLVMACETFLGLLNIAIATGVVFARVSRPTARVLFSEVATITNFDGVPTLMFRVANQRGNQILEAAIGLTMAHQVTTVEGIVMRRFQELKLVRSRTPLFALSWTVMHPLDEDSPLKGATRESMLDRQVELIVLLSGTDETFADTIHARHSYMPHEIHWNKRFVDILTIRADGRRVLDLNKFHVLKGLDSA